MCRKTWTDQRLEKLTTGVKLPFLCSCTGSYCGSISWRPWPKPLSRRSWRGGDVWSRRGSRISPRRCCLTSASVSTCNRTHQTQNRTGCSSEVSHLFLPAGRVAKHESSSPAPTASLQEVSSAGQEAVCLDFSSTGVGEDESKINAPTAVPTEHKTGETNVW